MGRSKNEAWRTAAYIPKDPRPTSIRVGHVDRLIEEDRAGAVAPGPEVSGVQHGGGRRPGGRRRAGADASGEATAALARANRCRTPGARPSSPTPPPDPSSPPFTFTFLARHGHR